MTSSVWLSSPTIERQPAIADRPASQTNLPNDSVNAVSVPPAGSPLRVLLWAPHGSGNQYNGPASFSYRLYSGAAPKRFRLTLAYGSVEQVDQPLFESQHQISPLVMLRSKPLQTWQFLRRGREWLRAHAREFDVMHALTGFHVSLAPAFEAERLGLPSAVFLAAHGVELSDKGGVRRLLGLPKKRRMMIRSISAVIAMSDAIVQELLDVGVESRRIARIPMGIDMQRFRPAGSPDERLDLRTRLAWPDRFTLAFVGELVERKRPHLFVEALALIRKQGLDAQIAFIGPANDAAYVDGIRRRAHELNVADRIIWHGFATDVSGLLRACDCFALPSSSEGMPAAMVEAMASGLPVIATPISGATDLIEDGRTGFFIEPTAEDFARVWQTYITDLDRTAAHGHAARQRVQAQFSREVVLDAYERMFRRIVAGGDAAE